MPSPHRYPHRLLAAGKGNLGENGRNGSRSRRACQRIGELSRDFAKAERTRTDLHLAARMQIKATALAAAGSPPTRADYDSSRAGVVVQ